MRPTTAALIGLITGTVIGAAAISARFGPVILADLERRANDVRLDIITRTGPR